MLNHFLDGLGSCAWCSRDIHRIRGTNPLLILQGGKSHPPNEKIKKQIPKFPAAMCSLSPQRRIWFNVFNFSTKCFPPHPLLQEQVAPGHIQTQRCQRKQSWLQRSNYRVIAQSKFVAPEMLCTGRTGLKSIFDEDGRSRVDISWLSKVLPFITVMK